MTKPLTPQQKLEACRLYQQGSSAAAIAEAWGFTPGTICKALKAQGIALEIGARKRVNPQAKADAAANYKRLISGKFELLEPYDSAKTPVLHRCLRHGYEARVTPTQLATSIPKGGGMRCCGIEALRNQNLEERRQQYDDFLALQGRFLRIGPYQGTETPTLHRCLAHGAEGLRRTVRDDAGMACCRKAAHAEIAQTKIEHSTSTYDERLRQFGKVERIGIFQGVKKKILHRCVEHGEVLMAFPSSVLKGHGLMCCRRAAETKRAQEKYDRHAATYDDRIAGRLKRLEPYQGAHVAIRHRCLIHGEEGLSRPGSSIAGHGLWCCRLAASGGDSVEKALTGTLPIQGETTLYLYEVIGFPELVKVGIAKNMAARKDNRYGAMVAEWILDTREEAVLLEAAILQATRKDACCPDELLDWDGFSELRKADPSAMTELMQRHVDMIHTDGIWLYSLAHVPLTASQAQLCEQNAQTVFS